MQTFTAAKVCEGHNRDFREPKQPTVVNPVFCGAFYNPRSLRPGFGLKRISPGLAGILRIMRITAIIMLAACLQVSAKGLSQTVTFSGKQVPLTRVFAAIEKQTGYVFFYDATLLRGTKPVTIDARQASVEAVLKQCLEDQQLDYSIENKTITIEKRKPAEEQPVKPSPPPVEVHGKIVNEQGEPLEGATVRVKGTKSSTTTDAAGVFVLKGVDENAALEISYVGFQGMTVPVNSRTFIPVALKRSNSRMDEIQVVAYGTVSKRFNVGSVSTVKADIIEQQPVTNVLLALEGRVPGLTVTPTSGAPGATIKVQVRGQNTLQSNLSGVKPFDQPLIIVDGVPLASQNQNINLLGSFGGGSGGDGFQGFAALSGINPSDIESVSVLRDADATSIYGSQGANGVILITTKKGVPGKTQLSLNVNTGPNKITRSQQFLNTQQYLDLRREGLQNDGITLPPVYDGTYPDLQLFDSTKYTDWFKEFFDQTSNNTDVYASLSGGAANAAFILTAGYNQSTYNFPGDFSQKRVTTHSAFHFQSKNNKLTTDFGTDLSYTVNNNPSTHSAGTIYVLPPNTPDLLDASGNLIWNHNGLDISGYQQYAYLKQPYTLKQYNLNSTLRVGYKIVRDLDAMINLGYSQVTAEEINQIPLASQSPTNPFAIGQAQFGNSKYETINIEPQVNYHQNIGKGVLTTLIGGTYKSNVSKSQNLTGYGYTNDAFLGSIAGAATITATNNTVPYKYVGAYGRVGYIYDQKYILNITGRIDGSSNFGPGKQYGNFGSVGAGWIISEERALKKAFPTLSFLKLSGNYGTNGSDGIAPYNYQDYWAVNSSAALFENARPYYPLNLYNPDYSWAIKKTLNLSLELGFFHDRLQIQAIYYDSRTANQLVAENLPIQTGFSYVVGNLNANVQNTGFEFTLFSTNIKSRNFQWSTTLNISRNRNNLLSFPGLDTSPYAYEYMIGKSTNAVYGFPYKGVNENTGLFEFYDAKGNVTGTPNFSPLSQGGDLQYIADLQPDLQGGINNTFTYKSISLSVFFQFAKQTAPNYMYGIYNQIGNPGMLVNMPVQVINRWRTPGDKSLFERAAADYSSDAVAAAGNFLYSSGAYSDDSYIRLKTLSISWSLPFEWVKKIGMESFRIYLNAQNLFTITDYEVGDPELPGQMAIVPMQRIFAGGLMVNF